jgi:hypothetical protein
MRYITIPKIVPTSHELKKKKEKKRITSNNLKALPRRLTIGGCLQSAGLNEIILE